MEQKKAILVVSFGTSYEETRKKTLEAIENDLKSEFPDRTFYRAWTSGMIRRKIKERDGMVIPSVEEAMEQICAEGVTDLLIQPALMLAGNEFNKIADAASIYKNRIETVRIGRPLLDTENDIEEMVFVLSRIFKDRNSDQMVVLMGHGSEEIKLPVYDLMNEYFEKDGLSEFCMGTVEFEPGIEPVLSRVSDRKPAEVLLTPFLIVAGDHALNDMSGDEEDSWKNRIGSMGPKVNCIVKGLGEYELCRSLLVEKARNAKAF